MIESLGGEQERCRFRESNWALGTEVYQNLALNDMNASLHLSSKGNNHLASFGD
jgi:hypothetical protein